jgi:hypothetical protein
MLELKGLTRNKHPIFVDNGINLSRKQYTDIPPEVRVSRRDPMAAWRKLYGLGLQADSSTGA